MAKQFEGPRVWRNIFIGKNVMEAALERLHWLYDQSDLQMLAGWSGGKDSTVLAHLAARVAEEHGRGPLDVFWIDQEAEYAATVELARSLFRNPAIRFHWFPSAGDDREHDGYY